MKKSLCLLLLLMPMTSLAFDALELDSFIDEVATRHQLQRQWLQTILYDAEKQQSILDAISRPAEKTRAWHEYRALFINEQRIRDGVTFWQSHRDLLETVAAECGVPARVIVAILGIETQYGTRTGGYRVIDALATLAFEYPPRSAFFRDELEQFLLLVQEESVDPLTAKGSYAGAMGAAQFISSSYRRYAVDGGGDGRVDLWSDWRDVIGSVANYLHSFGWQANAPIVEPIQLDERQVEAFRQDKIELTRTVGDLQKLGAGLNLNAAASDAAMVFELEHSTGPRHYVGYNNFYVVTRYNRSTMYAMAVLDLGDEIAKRVNTQ